MKKFLLLGALAPALFAEISAFDAGNIELENPYGLTASEKVVLKNKQHLEGLSKEYAGVDFKTRKALERIDGMQTILDDLGLKQQNFSTRINDFESILNAKDAAQAEQIALLKKQVLENTSQIARLKKAVSELADAMAISAKPGAKPQQSAAARQKAALQMMKNGDYFAAAAEFEDLIAQKFKPAANNFNLAECAFLAGDYERAIYHYKASSDSYRAQKAKIPNEPALLLHTAQSLERIGKAAQAKPFYEALKANFADSAEAKSIK